ncbi:MAG: hypothetical protein Q4F30_04365, partial [Akkermansia sp.]|nr:hypothetical protein [Akkermansia sp.]
MEHTDLELREGQTGRLVFTITAPEGTPTDLTGAVFADTRELVPLAMAGDGDNALLIPPTKAGYHHYEVRCGGATVLYGTLRTLPSPLAPPGAAGWDIDVDLTQELPHVDVSLSQGPQGPQGIQGPQGEVGPAGPSAYDAAVAAGYEGTEAEWMGGVADIAAMKDAAAASANAADQARQSADTAAGDAQASLAAANTAAAHAAASASTAAASEANARDHAAAANTGAANAAASATTAGEAATAAASSADAAAASAEEALSILGNTLQADKENTFTAAQTFHAPVTVGVPRVAAVWASKSQSISDANMRKAGTISDNDGHTLEIPEDTTRTQNQFAALVEASELGLKVTHVGTTYYFYDVASPVGQEGTVGNTRRLYVNGLGWTSQQTWALAGGKDGVAEVGHPMMLNGNVYIGHGPEGVKARCYFGITAAYLAK